MLIDVVEVLLGTSCRVSEAVGLRWQDVDLSSDPPTVEIVGHVVEGNGQLKRWEPGLESANGHRGWLSPITLLLCSWSGSGTLTATSMSFKLARAHRTGLKMCSVLCGSLESGRESRVTAYRNPSESHGSSLVTSTHNRW